MRFPVNLYFKPRVSGPVIQPQVNFNSAVEKAKKRESSEDTKQHKHNDGVTIHKVKHGDTAIAVGSGYGYKLAQLQMMNPGLRENPDILIEGDTLTILDGDLFDAVKKSSRLTDEAVTAERSYVKMTNSSPDTPVHVRKLNALEAPSVRQNSEDKRSEAAALLTPGLLEAALPSALDKPAMNKALDDHMKAISPVGNNQPEFDKIVQDATRDARSTVDEIFDKKVSLKDVATGDTRKSSLRELVAEAKNTTGGSRRQDPSAEWQNVDRGMIALLKDLSSQATTGDKATQKLAETQAVRNIAQILAAATPNRDLAPDVDPYTRSVNSAADHVLVQSSVDAVNAAGRRESDIDVPQLRELAKQTEGIDPMLAMERVRGSQLLVNGAVSDVLRQTVRFDAGSGALKTKSAMKDLSILADRMPPGDGKQVVQELASSVVRIIDDAGDKSSSKNLAGIVGLGLYDAVADGNSPALAKEIARQLMDKDISKSEHKSEASIILDFAGKGIEAQKKNATSTGKDFYEKVVYVSELGRQNIGESDKFSHADGVASLLKSEASLIERTDQMGRGLVLTAAASQDLPRELQGLDGAEQFQKAGKDIRDSLNADISSGKGEEAEINYLPLLRQYSPGAAVASQQIAADQAKERLKDLPERDLDKLVEELGRLPADDSYTELTKQLKSLDDPKAALYESPELTLALFNRFSQPEDARPGVESNSPSAGFLSRTGRDVLLEVLAFQKQAGGGLIPGVKPILPNPDLQKNLDTTGQRTSALGWNVGYDPANARRTGFSRLTDTANRLWLQANPIQPLQARGGVSALPHVSPFVSAGSALLNGWGAITLTNQELSPMDNAWGYYFGVGATRDAFLAVNGANSWRTGNPGFSQIKGMRGWEWLPRAYNGAGVALSVAQLGYELGKGDLTMAAAWAPGTAASVYAAIPGAVAAGPVVTIGFLLTAGLVTGIGQYRHVKESNRLEDPLGAYWKGAAPNADKPESLANCDEGAVPYIALNPDIAKAQNVSSEQMIEYLYDLDPGKRDAFIDRALQVKPGKDGVFPVRSEHTTSRGIIEPETGVILDSRMQRHQIKTIEDFQIWAKDWNYALPRGAS